MSSCFHGRPISDCPYCGPERDAAYRRLSSPLITKWRCPSCGGKADLGKHCGRCANRGWRALRLPFRRKKAA